VGAELAVADGALGFWQAIEQVWPQTREQRCWVHKTANVLNKLPESQQSKAEGVLTGDLDGRAAIGVGIGLKCLNGQLADKR
jgi:hypothetical protein